MNMIRPFGGLDDSEALVPVPPAGVDNRDEMDDDVSQFKYVNAVATVANVWRSTGIPDKLKACLKSMPDAGDGIANWVCERLPGRVLRGRWGSIDEVEELISPKFAWLKVAFVAMFGLRSKVEKKRNAATRRKPLTPGNAEAQTFSEEQKNYRLKAARLLSSPWFRISLEISKIVKNPLTHFYRGALIRTKEVNSCRKAALASNNVYLGPTMFSDLVGGRCAEVHAWIDQLLGVGQMNKQPLVAGV